jgi:hypothetical protein
MGAITTGTTPTGDKLTHWPPIPLRGNPAIAVRPRVQHLSARTYTVSRSVVSFWYTVRHLWVHLSLPISLAKTAGSLEMAAL